MAPMNPDATRNILAGIAREARYAQQWERLNATLTSRPNGEDLYATLVWLGWTPPETTT